MLLDEPVIPKPCPAQKVEGYEMPEHSDNLLSWDFVAAKMTQADHYWLASIGADGRPHTVPVWGIWYKNRVHFDGSIKTKWARNLVRNPRIAVHLPNPEQVVVIEGNAYFIDDDEFTEEEWLRLDTQFQSKYNVTEGSPYWYVQPTKVLAWNGGKLHTMTRWIFA